MTQSQTILIINLLSAITASASFSLGSVYCYSVLGISAAALSMMDGLSEGIGHLLKIFDGLFRDITKNNRTLLIVGLLLGLVSKACLYFSTSILGLILVSKIAERISNSFIGITRDIILSENEDKVKIYSLSQMYRTIGCVVGSFLIGLAITTLKDYSTIIFITALPILVCLLFARKIPLIEFEENPRITVQQIKEIFTQCFKNKVFITILIWSSLFGFARYNDSVVIIAMKKLSYSDAFCSSIIGMFNATGLIVSFLIFYYKEKLACLKHNSTNITALTYALFGSFLLTNMLLQFDTPLGIATWGIQRAISSILFASVIAMYVNKTIIGTSIGVFAVVNALVAILSGLMYGAIMNCNFKTTFVISNVFLALFCTYYNLRIKKEITVI